MQYIEELLLIESGHFIKCNLALIERSARKCGAEVAVLPLYKNLKARFYLGGEVDDE